METGSKPTRRRFTAGAVSLFVTASGLRPTQIHAQEIAMQHHVIEIVTFKLAKGADEAQFLASNAAVDRFVRSAPGFVARRLSRSEDGTYVDHVEWASLAAAKAAAEVVMTLPDLAPFMQMIDAEEVKMAHNRLIWAVN